MIPLTLSHGLTAKGSYTTRHAWSPPALILEAAGDDDGLIVNLIDAFVGDTDARLEQMCGALAASRFPDIRAEAHTIKGSARQMGADAVGEACQELEIACGLQRALPISARLNRLQELFEEICGAMAAYVNNRSMTP